MILGFSLLYDTVGTTPYRTTSFPRRGLAALFSIQTTHVRGALTNGLSPKEISAVLTQIAIYCGIPVGVDCFRMAKPIVSEQKKG